ncbi:MAG TPA: ABC transporter permease [Streptosporangiaceae bacterium]|nr:ABC transporter permease [Streptosporangiaceae bacterium]
MTSQPLRILPPAGAGRWPPGQVRGNGRGGTGRGGGAASATPRGLLMVERSIMVYRRSWPVLISGFFEPLFYLLSIGLGLGALVGKVPGPAGRPIGYVAFVAPAMLASASMNGAIFDATFNVFFKLKYEKLYDSVLATPMTVGNIALGEITWALLRGAFYAAMFLIVMAIMGLIHSPWAVLALPGAVLIGWAFAATGMAATCYLRSWQDFDYITMVMVPMFLFSATFYPLAVYPRALQVVVEAAPLYQGVALLRGLTLGAIGPGLLGHAAYLAAMGLAGPRRSGTPPQRAPAALGHVP